MSVFSFPLHSPIPHQPCLPTKETFSPELVPCSDSDRLDGLLQLCDKGTVELQHKEKSSIRVVQKNNHLEAVIEDSDATDVSFFLGDSQDDPESLSLAELTQQRSCRIQTPVEVHSTVGAGFEVNCGEDSELEGVSSVREASVTTLDAEEQTVAHSDTEEQADQWESSEEANIENNFETEKCVNSVAILDFNDSDAGIQEDILEDVYSEKQVLENHVICEVKGLEHVADVSCPEEVKNSDGQNEPDNKESAKSDSKEKTPLESEVQEENHDVHIVPQVESSDDDTQMDQEQVDQEVDLVGTKGESDEDSHSLPSSNESIVKVSDEESICDEAEDSIKDENGYMKTSREEVTLWSEVDHSSRNILDIHLNGCPEEKEDISTPLEAEDLQYMTEINDLSDSPDINSTVTGGDLTENSDFSILETSCSPGLEDGKYTE